jgi:formylglycine-generating enzyme required for sulfatase activity
LVPTPRGGIAHAVGTREANPLGLHDMLGNVWEWTEDRWEADAYAPFRATPAIDPVGPDAGDTASGDTCRYVRGGSWASPAEHCRAASRQSPNQDYKTGAIGFRVALPVESVKAAIAGKPQ